MPGSEDGKDVLQKAPHGDDQVTTPLDAGGPSGTASDQAFADSVLRALRGRYDILAEMGRGGMGIVYKARDRETDEVVALKVLKPEIASRSDVVERFKAELRLARKITHKNVCRTYELLRFDDTVVIAMEYVEGESLRAILNRFGGVPLRRGLEWARQICNALGEAHAQGVVHRDLKPENILIDRRGQAKVMDFGIARSIETDATMTGSIVGTPAYMSPEQVEAKPVDHRADIYALGLIFYEMFTGQGAFKADTPVAFALKQIHDTPPPPRSVECYVPLFLDRAIQKCLEKNPAKRFQSAAELSAALADQPEVVVPIAEAEGKEISLPYHLTRWQRFDWALVGAAAVSLVIFFSLFDRVFPYGAAAPAMSKSEAISATRAIAEKYAPELKDKAYLAELIAFDRMDWFPPYVTKYGLRNALAYLTVHAHSWNLRTSDEGIRIGYDQQGRPQRLLLLPASKASMPKERPTQQEVLPFAIQTAEDLFHVRVADVPPVPLEYDSQRDKWTFDNGKTVFGAENLRGTTLRPVLWILPGDRPDWRKQIKLVVSPGKLFSAEVQFEWVSEALWDWMEWWDYWIGAVMVGSVLLGLLGLICLVLSFTRKLYGKAPRMVWGVSLVTALAVLGMFVRELPGESQFHEANTVLKLLACIVTLLLSYVLLSVPYHYLSKTFPTHLKTLADLLTQGLRAQPAGLAILRGVLLGVAYLAFHASSLLVLGWLKIASTSTMWMRLSLEGSQGTVSAVWVVAISFLAGVAGPWLWVGLPLSLFRRATTRFWLLLAAMAVFWAVTAGSLTGASAFPILPLYLYSALQGLFFALVFLRYDLLTCMMTTLTIETWLLCYPPYRMFGGFEPWPYAAAVLPWFLILLLGAVLWLRPPVAAFWRRAAAVLE